MRFTRLGLTAAIVFLAGCAMAPQQPVAFVPQPTGAASPRIGVVMSKLPKVDTSFPGAGCLLCLGVAAVANSSLTTHTQALPTDDVLKIKDDAAAALTAKGVSAKVIADPIDLSALPSSSSSGVNVARKDFGSLKAKYQIDKVLVVDVTTLGMVRQYAEYIPTSDPKASLIGAAYLVNLSNNTLEWYVPLTISRAADGKWDESPDFPGLTNAYFQAIEMARDAVVKPLEAPPAAPATSAASAAAPDPAAAHP